MVLRLLVLMLALAAGGKIAWQEHAYRSALKDTVVGVYRERAIRACDIDSRALRVGLPPAGWAAADSLTIRIAGPDLWPWQDVEPSRRGQPVLVLSFASTQGPLHCAYNVVTAVATVERS